jgi:putative acetyltransferase
MMARAKPALALRPFLASDTPLLAEIFRASVEDMGADDYTEAQVAAWASAADDEAAFGKRLGGQLTLIATMDGSPIGFASLKGTDEIDMLYVHPAAAGEGAAKMLLDALERLATSRGAARLIAEASDSAHDFFRQHGFVDRQRNTVSHGDEWLSNTTMEKPLGPKRSTS